MYTLRYPLREVKKSVYCGKQRVQYTTTNIRFLQLNLKQ